MAIECNWYKARYIGKTATYFYEDKDPITINIYTGETVEDEFRPTKHIWDTFLDTANGELVDSMDKMRDRERQGQIYCTPDEASREARKNKKYLQEKMNQANSQEFRASMRDTLRRTGTMSELRKMKRGY